MCIYIYIYIYTYVWAPPTEKHMLHHDISSASMNDFQTTGTGT